MEENNAGLSVSDYKIIECDFDCSLSVDGEWKSSGPFKLTESPASGYIKLSCSLHHSCDLWTRLDVKVIKSCPRPAMATIKLQLRDMNPKIVNLNFWENELNFRLLPLNLDSQSCLKLGDCFESNHDYKSHKYFIEIKCKIIWYGFVEEFNPPNSVLSFTRYSDKMAFCDMKIKVGDKYYPAHTLILTSQSSVFKETLMTNIKESKENCIDLTHLGTDIVEQLLLFLYENRIDHFYNNESFLLKLLNTGGMYNIPNLKNCCAMSLSNILTEENALMLLKNAYIHNFIILKQRAIAFIVVEGREIMNGIDFEELGLRYPKLLLEIINLSNLLA